MGKEKEAIPKVFFLRRTGKNGKKKRQQKYIERKIRSL